MKVLRKGNNSNRGIQNWTAAFTEAGFDQGGCCCFDDKC